MTIAIALICVVPIRLVLWDPAWIPVSGDKIAQLLKASIASVVVLMVDIVGYVHCIRSLMEPWNAYLFDSLIGFGLYGFPFWSLWLNALLFPIFNISFANCECKPVLIRMHMFNDTTMTFDHQDVLKIVVLIISAVVARGIICRHWR